MIEFTNEGSVVYVKVESRYPLSGFGSFAFKFEAGSPWAALLLREHLAGFFGAAVEDVKSRAYRLGWKEGRSKKTSKRICFSRVFDGGAENV